MEEYRENKEKIANLENRIKQLKKEIEDAPSIQEERIKALKSTQDKLKAELTDAKIKQQYELEKQKEMANNNPSSESYLSILEQYMN